MSETRYIGMVPDPERPGRMTLLSDGHNILYGSKKQIQGVIDQYFEGQETCALPLKSITKYLEAGCTYSKKSIVSM